MKANQNKAQKRKITTSSLALKSVCNTPQHRRRLKPKRLIIPQLSSQHLSSGQEKQSRFEEEVCLTTSTTNFNPKDIYELDALRLYWNLTTRPVHRPLPAIASILAVNPKRQHPSSAIASRVSEEDNVAHARQLEVMEREKEIIRRTSTDMPLLKDFFDQVRTRKGDNETRLKKDSVIDKSPFVSQKNCNNDERNPLEKISNTLTKGHHRKFKEILAVMEKQHCNNKKFKDPHREREFKRLCELIHEERRLYYIALEQFKQENADRFLQGFKISGPASVFVDTNSRHVKHFQMKWKNSKLELASQYGVFCQAVSLQGQRKSHTKSKAIPSKNLQKVDMDTFSPKIVTHCENMSVSSTTTLGRTQLPIVVGPDWLESSLEQKILSTPHMSHRIQPQPTQQSKDMKHSDFTTADSSPLLCEDSIAKDLALKYKANCVITSKALMTLLLLPGKDTARWILTFASLNLEDDISDEREQVGKTSERQRKWEATFVEDPIPHSTTPRECMSVGINEAIYHHVMLTQIDEASKKDSYTHCNNGMNVYTLLTLPQSQTKVLVRSTNIMFQTEDKISDNESNQDHHYIPIQLHAQLEYFPEVGMEEYNSYDRAVWLMQKILQPNAKVVTCRVDPKIGKVLRLEEKTLAHALLSPDTRARDLIENKLGNTSKIALSHGVVVGSRVSHVAQHFQVMVDVIQGILQVRHGGRYVICLPGRSGKTSISSPLTTATVHQEINRKKVNKTTTTVANIKNDVLVDIDQEISEADKVFLGKETLFECFRPWEWTNDRIAYTFPFQGEDEEQ